MPTGLDGNPRPIHTAVRDAVLRTITHELLALRPHTRICVGVDGAAGSGKSTFADELASRLEAAGRPAVRSTTDSFHNPRVIRYQRGRMSAEGYYRDSHDLEALRQLLLDPFIAGAAYRTAVFDEPSDCAVDVPPELPRPSAVLVFDGLFLHRPLLRGYWDYSIYLDAATRARRDLAEAGSPARDARLAGTVARYVGGWQLYVDECDPEHAATKVVDNNDLAAPALRAGSGSRGVPGG